MNNYFLSISLVFLSLIAVAQQQETPQQLHQRMKRENPKYPKSIPEAVQRAFQIEAPDDVRYGAILDYARLEEPYVQEALDCMDNVRTASPLVCFVVTYKNMEMFVKQNIFQIVDHRFDDMVTACHAYHQYYGQPDMAQQCKEQMKRVL